MKQIKPAVGLFLIATTIACSANTEDSVAHQTAAVTGGDTTVDYFSSTLPDQAVGVLVVPNRPPSTGTTSCSGTLIARNVVLTDAHCFVDAQGQLPLAAGAVQFLFPDRVTLGFDTFRNNGGIGSGIFLKYNGLATSLVNPNSPESIAQADLAVMILNGKVTQQELPNLPAVYTSADFRDRALNVLSDPSQRFFQAPVRVAGYDGFQFGVSTPTLKTGTVTDNLDYQQDCGILGLEPAFGGTCSGYWITYTPSAGATQTQFGDSGGPMTFMAFGSTPTLMANVRGSYGGDLTFSPTWDNGSGNGGFIRQFLVDADNDGVADIADNCPPSLCLYDVSACANPNQADLDADGIGDVCDNCDPALCAARGWPVAACSNSNQFDADHDGAGDQCDSCIVRANGATMHDPNVLTQQLDDQDLDGVGDACDNCNKPNGYAACQSSATCGVSVCEAAGQLGFCVGGSTPGTACGASGSNFGECGGDGNCVNLGANGRCAVQLDDVDGDGVGGKCDLCPNNPDTRINSNSNDAAEQQQTIQALGDICDPVPVYVSRPNFGVTGDPLGSTATYTTFYSTAGLGEGGTRTSIPATVGFRYCSCLTSATSAFERSQCLKNQCFVNDSLFSAPGVNPWTTITTAASGIENVAPTTPGLPPVDQQLFRSFTTAIDGNDGEQHFQEIEEHYRIGTAEILKWFHQADIARGVVPTNSGGHATGIFWSHTLSGTLFTSTRDSATAGLLRDDHEYVTIPFIPIPSLPPAGGPPVPCRFGGCLPWWNPSWAADPETYVSDPSTLQEVSLASRLLVGANQTVVAVRGPGTAQVDVTSSLPQNVANLLFQGQVSWLSPAEPAGRGLEPGARIGAIMPAQWTQASIRPSALINDAGTLRIFSRFDQSSARTATPSSLGSFPEFVPSDRDGARSLFSSREQSVYLLGGHQTVGAAGGSLTNEVWKYDFNQDSWTHIFRPSQDGKASPAIGDVEALTYDDRNRRMIVIDSRVASLRARHGREHEGEREHQHQRDVSQLLELDLATQRVHVLTVFPRTNLFERVSLATQDDGSYILIGSLRDHWIAFRFDVVSERGLDVPRWTGVAQGEGEVLDDPIRVTEGNDLPVLRHGAQDVVLLSNSVFDRSGRRCDAL